MLDALAKRIVRILAKRYKIARAREARVEVHPLPNRFLRSLKKKYLKKDAVFVDVLAFPEPRFFPHPETRGTFLGEVYVNSRLLKRKKDLRFALVHGILHLVGYRHRGKGDSMKMQKLEERLLKELM